jgi:DNA-binding response OmpR family regulator
MLGDPLYVDEHGIIYSAESRSLVPHAVKTDIKREPMHTPHDERRDLLVMTESILIVEDEVALRESLAFNLGKEGFSVETLGEGSQVIDLVREKTPDIIILDIMLPGLDGLDVMRLLRQEFSIPVLMLTARDSEIDRVLGLELGADDYMTKPFSMRELIARVKALLRRVRLDRAEGVEARGVEEKILRFDDLTINTARHEVLLKDEVIPLRPKEYDLLLFLARNRGQVLSRSLILERVWGWDFSGNTRTVDVHIRWLRAKIEPDAEKPQRIITVRGAGYRFDG